MRQLGKEVVDDPDIVDITDLYYETQLAFSYYRTAPDKWEGMAGLYLGKDLTLLPYFIKRDKVDKPTELYIWTIISYIDSIMAKDISEKQEAKRKSNG